MPLTTVATPCWTFTCQREDATSARWREHAPNPARLLFMHGDGCCRPYQLDSRCVEAVCDRCRIPYLGRHFATMAQASDRLERAAWTGDGRGRWHCPSCPIAYGLTDEATEALAGVAKRPCRFRRSSRVRGHSA